MRIGMSIKIDVTKIDKSRLFKGKKGTYLDLTSFIDTEEEGEYGDHGTVSQSVSQEERSSGKKMPFIGNVKVFWQEAGYEGRPKSPEELKEQYSDDDDDDDDDIPF